MDCVSNFIYFDGGVYGQKVCVHDVGKNKYIVKHIKEGKTNNELEYWALIIAIRYANRNYNSKDRIMFNGDSKLIINQIWERLRLNKAGEMVWGTWRINKERLFMLNNIVKKELEKANYKQDGRWIRRERNFAGAHLEKLMKSDKNV